MGKRLHEEFSGSLQVPSYISKTTIYKANLKNFIPAVSFCMGDNLAK